MNREDFPLISGSKLIYFDNAATMQKPRQVLDAVRDFYEHDNANSLRGMYELAVRADERVFEARKKVAEFIGAKDPREITFVSNATEGLNMIASWLSPTLSSDDEVLIGQMEHHSNLLPWARIVNERGAHFGFIPSEADGTILASTFEKVVTPNTKVVAISLLSNVLGAKNEVREIIRIAHSVGALVVVDAAQAVAHMLVSASDLDADFLVFSGHKIGAPMGIGAVYGKLSLMEKTRPMLLGGGMVEDVSIIEDRFRFKTRLLPSRNEAGTQNIGGMVGLAAAIDYLSSHDGLWECEAELTAKLSEGLRSVPLVTVYGAGYGIVSFNIAGVHPHDTAQVLADAGICVRAGYHCAQPGLDALGYGPVVRASLCFYNTESEVSRFLEVVATVRKKMGLS